MSQLAVNLATDLFELAPIALFHCDSDLRVQRSNRAAADLLPTAAGTTLTSLLTGLADDWASPQVVSLNSNEGVRYLQLSATPLGQPGLLIAATDVSYIEGARRTAATECAAMSATLDNLTDGISLVEPDGTVRYINPVGRAFLGLTADQPLGDLSQFLGTVELRDASGRRLSLEENPTARALAGEVFPGTDLYMTGPDGEQHVVNISGSSIKSEAGAVELAITSARDVTATRKVERELEASRDELLAVIENLVEAVLLTDPDGTVRYINMACFKLMGILDPTLAPPFAQFSDFTVINPRYLDGRSMPVTDYPITRSSAGEVYEGFEFLITGLDGVERRISVNGSHLRNEHGHIVRGITSVRDLTSFYQAQQEIRDSRDELQAVLENLPDAVLLIEPDGTVRSRNRAHRELMGLNDIAELPRQVQMDSVQVLRDGMVVDPNDLLIKRIMRGETVSEEVTFVLLDGSRRILNSSGTSLKDESGNVRLAIMVNRDISKQRELEQSYKQKSEELQEILNSMPDSVIVMEPNGNVVLRNRANRELHNTVGHLPTDEQGNLLSGNFYPDGRPMPMAKYPRYQAARGETVKDAEVHYRDRDGELHIMSVNANSIRDEAGNVRLAISVARDVTAMRQLEVRYRQRSDELQAILDNMTEGVTVLNSDGAVRYTNRAGLALIGADNEDGLPNTTQSQVFEPRRPSGEVMPVAGRPAIRALAGETFHDVEMIVTNLRGEERIISVSGSAVHDEAGSVLLAINTYRDVTGQRALERDVQASRDQLQAILENLTEGVTVINPDGTTRYTNRAGRRISGVENELGVEVSDYPQLQLRHVDGRPMSNDETPRVRVMRGEQIRDEQVRLAAFDGLDKITTVSGDLIRNQQGEIELGFTVYRDITAQYQLEREVRDSRDQLQAILDNMSEAVVLTAPDGSITYSNPAAQRMTGVARLGHFKTSSDFKPLSVRHPDGSPMPVDDYPSARAVRGQVFSEQPILFTDLAGEDHVVSVTGYHLRDEEGGIRLGINISRDITGQYRLERDLQASRDRLQAVLDNMPDSVVLFNPDGTVQYRNAASRRLVGQETSQQLDQIAAYDQRITSTTLDGRELTTADYPASRVLAGEQQVSLEFNITRPDGSSRVVSQSAVALQDAAGATEMVVAVTRDLSRLYELERGYRSRSEELTAILDNMTEGIVALETDGSIRYLNAAARQIIGLDPDRRLATLSEMGDLNTRYLDGRPIPNEESTVYRAAMGEVFTNDEVIFTDLRGQERTISVAGSSVRDEAGNVRLIINSFRDITAVRALEADYKARSEELQAVLDNLTEGVSFVDANGKLTYINKAGLHLAGMAEGMPPDPVIANPRYPDGRPMPEDQYPRTRALQGEVFTDVELLITGLDGVGRLVSVSGTHLRDEAGHVRLAINTSRDITAQRKLEREVRANRDELQAILDNMTEGVIIMQPDGTLSYLNRAGRQLLNVEIGKEVNQLADFSATNFNISYPDGRTIPVEQYPLNRAAAGEVFTDSELLFNRRDGIRLMLSIGGSAVRDERGAVRLSINVFRDITSQREIENQIAQLLMQAERERQRLLTVIEQLPAGVVVFSAPDGAVLAHNNFSLEMLKLDTVTQFDNGDPATARYHLTRTDGVLLLASEEPVARAMQGERVINEQWRVQFYDGSNRDLLVSAVPIYDADERVFGVATIFQDISDLKELERLKDEFISITSHELRTPLTTIKGYGQMLARKIRKLDLDDAGRADFQKPLDTILERSDRMIGMVSDLLDVSRIATGRFEVVGQAFDLSAATVGLVEEAQEARKLPVELHLPDEPVLVVGEERLIEQVLNNLLGNAAKYSPPASAITVRVERDEAFATVSVEDQGIGIPAEQQARLFERFYRTERGKQTASGLGLGLYISNGIVQAHGGRMWVSSEGEGKGTAFYFTLPLVK